MAAMQRCVLSIRKGAEAVAWAPSPLFERIGKRRTAITLSVGSKKIVVALRASNGRNLFVTKNVSDRLSMGPGSVSYFYENGSLHLGPWVAILSPRKRTGPLFGEQTTLFKDMIKIARNMGVRLYVAQPTGFCWLSGHVIGVTLDARDRWVTRKCPIPNFLIQRTVVFSKSMHQSISKVERRLASQYHTDFLSRTIGSKWDVYGFLLSSQQLVAHLPETVPLRRWSDVKKILDKYETIYFKPMNGTQGMGVRKIIRLPRGYRWSERTLLQTYRHQLLTQEAFRRKMSHFFTRTPYLLQQGIDLLRVDQGRPVDFRWLVQKDGKGVWTVTARVARCGNTGSITTNLHTGGQAIDALQLLTDYEKTYGSFDQTPTQLVEAIDRLSLLTAQTLERRVGTMGEIGIDFAVTPQGAVWILECNPRPGRKMLRTVNRTLRQLSLRRPLEYAKYTTGFTS